MFRRGSILLGIYIPFVSLLVASLPMTPLYAVEISTRSVSTDEIRVMQETGKKEQWSFSIRENEATARPLSELTGYLAPLVEPQAPLLAPVAVPAQLPVRYKSKMPPVRNQFGCGSCWAFATVGATEASIIKFDSSMQLTLNLSEQHLLDCTENSCIGGAESFQYFCDTRDYCGRVGALDEADYPYRVGESDCQWQLPRKHWLTSWGFASGNPAIFATPAQIKAAIMQYGAVTCLIYATPQFIGYDSGIFDYSPPQWTFPNHMVVIYGWDDDYDYRSPAAAAKTNPIPVWHVRNSWGTGWGIDGNGVIDQRCQNVLDYRCAYGVYTGESDLDQDGIANLLDNCPREANPSQSDSDGDGIGDVCDGCPQIADPQQADADRDSISDICDNCTSVANPTQSDLDLDGLGDLCDTDKDGDGLTNLQDNCPTVYNPGQEDSDFDGKGDLCDFCPADPGNDLDGDSICALADNCANIYNPNQSDIDNDGIGDLCDNCPDVGNASQEDSDHDQIGNPCDPCPLDYYNDQDGDGYCANQDNCPYVYNPNQADTDGDGIGNACDFQETIDAYMSTPITGLIANSRANFGRRGNYDTPFYIARGYWNLDYAGQGDLDSISHSKIYLYDGSPVVARFGANDWKTGMSFLSEQTFLDVERDYPTSRIPVQGDFEYWSSGTVALSDSTVGLQNHFWAPRQADSANFIIQAILVYSYDGQSHDGVSIGELVDWRVPTDSGYGNIGYDSSLYLLYQQGIGDTQRCPLCSKSERRFGGTAFLGSYVNDSCLYSTAAPLNLFWSQTLDCMADLAVRDSAASIFHRRGHYTVDPRDGQSLCGMTLTDSITIGTADTLYFFLMHASIRNGTLDSLQETVRKARVWFSNNVQNGCRCCKGKAGNVNFDSLDRVDLSDLSRLISYLVTTTVQLSCPAEGNTSGDISNRVDLTDLAMLIHYLRTGDDVLRPCNY